MDNGGGGVVSVITVLQCRTQGQLGGSAIDTFMNGASISSLMMRVVMINTFKGTIDDAIGKGAAKMLDVAWQQLQ